MKLPDITFYVNLIQTTDWWGRRDGQTFIYSMAFKSIGKYLYFLLSFSKGVFNLEEHGQSEFSDEVPIVIVQKVLKVSIAFEEEKSM